MNRPPAVTVFAVINIIFGAIGVCGGVMYVAGTAMQLSGEMSPETQSPFIAELDRGPVFQAYTYFSMVLGLVLSVALIAAAVGMFRGREWGRKLSIYYSYTQFVLVPIGLLVTALYLPGMVQQITAEMGEEEAQFMSWYLYATSGCSALIPLVYAALLFYFMTRDDVKRYFAGATDIHMQDPGANPPPPPPTGAM